MASIVVEIGCLPSVDVGEIPACDAMVLPVFEDMRPLMGLSGRADWRLRGGLSRLLKGKVFSGLKDETCLVPSQGLLPADKLVLLGLGPRDDYSATQAFNRFQTAVTALKSLGAQSQCWPLFDLADGLIPPEEGARWVFEALEWHKPEGAMGYALVGGGAWNRALHQGLMTRSKLAGCPWDIRFLSQT